MVKLAAHTISAHDATKFVSYQCGGSNRGAFAADGGNILCLLCKPEHNDTLTPLVPFTDKTIALRTTNETYNRYWEAKHSVPNEIAGKQAIVDDEKDMATQKVR